MKDRDIAAVLDRIDVKRLGACSACLFEAAWPMHQGDPPRKVAGAVTTVARLIWWEIHDRLRAELVRLQMRGVEGAADALADLDRRGWRSRVVRRIVERLAGDMASEMAQNPLPRARFSLVPDDP